jgi:hypothetical protein
MALACSASNSWLRHDLMLFAGFAVTYSSQVAVTILIGLSCSDARRRLGISNAVGAHDVSNFAALLKMRVSRDEDAKAVFSSGQQTLFGST